MVESFEVSSQSQILWKITFILKSCNTIIWLCAITSWCQLSHWHYTAVSRSQSYPSLYTLFIYYLLFRWIITLKIYFYVTWLDCFQFHGITSILETYVLTILKVDSMSMMQFAIYYGHTAFDIIWVYHLCKNKKY